MYFSRYNKRKEFHIQQLHADVPDHEFPFGTLKTRLKRTIKFNRLRQTVEEGARFQSEISKNEMPRITGRASAISRSLKLNLTKPKKIARGISVGYP